MQRQISIKELRALFEVIGITAYADAQHSPFPPMVIPPMEEMTLGDWKVRKLDPPPSYCRGFFSGLVAVDKRLPFWVLDRAGQIWMSAAPAENESMAHHALVAEGKVLVGGFGMGALAFNVARKEEVRSVTVIERDLDIIKLASFFVAQWWPEEVARKVRLVHADMLTYQSFNHFDYALIDIWEKFGDDALRPDMQRIRANLPYADRFAAWTMELDFISYCMEQRLGFDEIKWHHWIKYQRDIGVPLILSRDNAQAQVMVKVSKMAALQAAHQQLGLPQAYA